LSAEHLMPIRDSVLGLLEGTAAERQNVDDVLGADIDGFCARAISLIELGGVLIALCCPTVSARRGWRPSPRPWTSCWPAATGFHWR
jgi:hypothetical protein